MIKFDNVWGRASEIPPSGFVDLPAHKAKNELPAGGSEVFVGGSARWVKAKEMLFIYSWNPSAREMYFYQDDLAALEPYRNSLKTIQ